MRNVVLAVLLVAPAFAAATSTASASTTAAVTVSAASAVLTAPPPGVDGGQGGVSVGLVDAPTATRDDPRARQYIVDHLPPGSVIHRRIEVSNTTLDPMHIAMYAAAAGIADGTFLGAPGHTANDLSSWTTLDENGVDLPPGAKTTVVVTVAVPTDAAPGEQYAAIWAEVNAPHGVGVNLVNRIGIRIYLSVGPGNAPASNFTIDSLTAQRAPDRHPVVAAQVHNTGGRALDMSGTLSLSDGPGSLNAGPFPAQLGSTLAPGQSATVTIDLNQQLPDGPWTADLTLNSGLIQQNAHARIQFPPDPGTSPVTPIAAQPPAVPLWILIGSLILLTILAIAGLAVVVHRRRARRKTAQH
ncbi:hypothetical protein [Actinophytocola sp.]|uniref:hypothetical protein n=1 Tax=Actinophytocola sp. TaxID=1872138 RepID=UPI002ED5C352